MRKEHGTTLAELSVVMAIMGILLLLAQKVVTAGYDFYRETDESITLQREGLLALTRITQDLSISHQPKVRVDDEGTADSKLSIPVPLNLNSGHSEIDNAGKGRLLWQTVIGYQLGPESLARPLATDAIVPPATVATLTTPLSLFRYADDVKKGTGYPTFDTATDAGEDYPTRIQFVDTMPSVLDIVANTNVPPRTLVAARNVIEFNVKLNEDTIDIQLTIMLPGKVQGATSLDNSLTLKTTVDPKN